MPPMDAGGCEEATTESLCAVRGRIRWVERVEGGCRACGRRDLRECSTEVEYTSEWYRAETRRMQDAIEECCAISARWVVCTPSAAPPPLPISTRANSAYIHKSVPVLPISTTLPKSSIINGAFSCLCASSAAVGAARTRGYQTLRRHCRRVCIHPEDLPLWRVEMLGETSARTIYSRYGMKPFFLRSISQFSRPSPTRESSSP
ncbi:hypothetical protein LXA43DRAFT_556947 [Ganoderma leucocontextum]|nr:hypothetical protein LXA43DRAFT_556947 [Ganoderma leucocontextum]